MARKQLPQNPDRTYDDKNNNGILDTDEIGTIDGTDAGTSGVSDAALYGISEALIAAHPELKEIFDLFKAKNTGKALELLFKSNYFKNTGAVVKAREKMYLEQRPAWEQELAKYILSARKRLVTAGIKIDKNTFEELARDAYVKGLDDNQLDQALLTSGKVTGFGGDVLGSTDELTMYANQFGVDNYFTKEYWAQKSQDLFAGITTEEDIQKEIRDKAASAFPAYAEQIANGVSMEAIASAYKGAMSSILEKDSNSFTWQDSRLRAALQYIGPDGKPAVKPLWQFEKELRSTPEWAYTNNARDTLDSLTLKVGQDWGLA